MIKLDTFMRKIQSLFGSKITELIQNNLGKRGTRFVREILGRTARHRVQIQCHKELIGNKLDGWIICPDSLVPEGIVYSLGVGKDISFDLEIIEKHKVNVFAFDPTPISIEWINNQNLPARFHFIDYGIMDFDGIARFKHLQGVQFGTHISNSDQGSFIEVQVSRLKTIMEKLNHTKIQVLKMNIEGGEYAVIDDLVASNLNIEQIVVEFHHRLPGFFLQKTYRAVKLLNEKGYKIFNISDNGKEYSFIQTNN